MSRTTRKTFFKNNAEPEPMQPGLTKKWIRFFRPLRDYYFRASIEGFERIPKPPALFIANHDCGYVPVDAVCLASFWFDHPKLSKRKVHTLIHDIPFQLFKKMSSTLYRMGFLPASYSNAESALKKGNDVLLFPGGAYESFRPYWERQKITLAGRTGFVKLALKMRVPIVPVVMAGGHETIFVISRGTKLARALGISRLLRTDVIPLWAGFPWGLGWGPFMNVPLPSKIQIKVLDPIDLHEELKDFDSSDDPDGKKKAAAGLEIVVKRMQAASDALYSRRRGINGFLTPPPPPSG